MKNAIVTGANGFVGTWLVKKLSSQNVQVTAVIKDENENISDIKDLPGVKIVYCELSDILSLADKIEERNFDCFYHLAWIGSAGPLRADYEVQLMNSKFSCDAARAAKELSCGKFLCAGTITERIIDNVIEDTTLGVSQNMIYGIAKKATRTVLSVFCRSIGLPFVWMQFSNIYGPLNKSGNLISYALGELKKGNVPEFSQGSQPYDFVYISDIIDAIYLLGESKLNHDFYFLGSGSPRLLRDYLSQIPSAMGDGAEIALGKRPEDGITYDMEWFSVDRLHRDTGYVAKHSFEDGLAKTVEWIKSV